MTDEEKPKPSGILISHAALREILAENPGLVITRKDEED